MSVYLSAKNYMIKGNVHDLQQQKSQLCPYKSLMPMHQDLQQKKKVGENTIIIKTTTKIKPA